MTGFRTLHRVARRSLSPPAGRRPPRRCCVRLPVTKTCTLFRKAAQISNFFEGRSSFSMLFFHPVPGCDRQFQLPKPKRKKGKTNKKKENAKEKEIKRNKSKTLLHTPFKTGPGAVVLCLLLHLLGFAFFFPFPPLLLFLLRLFLPFLLLSPPRHCLYSLCVSCSHPMA